MTRQAKWEKRNIQCPEGKGEGELLTEWQNENGKEILTGISCNNPKLRDLSGEDCNWSCWKEVSKKKAK